MSKALGNIGKATVGTARAGLNVGLAALKTPGAKLAQAKSAALTRKSNIEKGITRKLGSRLGLRKDEYSRRKKLEKSQDRVEKSRQETIKQRALSIKKAREARQKTKDKGGAIVPSKGGAIVPSKGDASSALATRPKSGAIVLSKGDTSSALATRPKSGAIVLSKGGAIVPTRKEQVGEEFIYEVGQMKEKKLNKVIDILKGKKNNIEISPKIKESMNWKDNYKPIEIETTNLIEPKKLNPSDWRKEIFEI